jgi:transcriptional regulator with XRE-family HTH domain
MRRCNSVFKITLEAARVNAGLDQKDAAKRLKISNTTLGKWERYESFHKADKISEICELYGIPYDHINFLPQCSLKENAVEE